MSQQTFSSADPTTERSNSNESTDSYYETITCPHSNVRALNCTTCGVFKADGVSGLKTNRYACNTDESSQRYLSTLKARVKSYVPLREKFAFSEAVFEFCQAVAEKFEFGIQTLALGLHLYQLLVAMNSEKVLDYSLKMEFYSSVCLMVAAKAIELDRRIPYFSRYQKYAAKDYSKGDYEAAEKEIILAFQFNVQKPTFVTFINFFLSNGIVFTDEQFPTHKVFLIEEKLRESMFKSLKNGTFILHEPAKLAANMLHETRKEFKLEWHHCLETYSGVKSSEFHETQILKPICLQQAPVTTRIVLNPQARHNFSLVLGNSNNNSSVTNHQSSKQNQEFKSDKKREGIQSKQRILLHKSKPVFPLRSVPSYSSLNVGGGLISFRRIDQNNLQSQIRR